MKPTPHPESLLTPIWRTEDDVDERGNRYETWMCRCKCSNNIRVTKYRLVKGRTKSCGCLRREMALVKLNKGRQTRWGKQGEKQHAATR